MKDSGKNKILKIILALIPILLVAIALVLLHTRQSIVIENHEAYSFADNEGSYRVLEDRDGFLELSVARDAEDCPDITLTSERKIDVFPSILGVHFRHDAFYGEDYGKYDNTTSRYTFTLTGRYIRRASLVLQQYELFFRWVLGVVLILYVLFLLDCMAAFKGKKRAIVRILGIAILFVAASALNNGYKYLHDQFSYVSFDELVYHFHTDLGGANFSEFSVLYGKVLTHTGIAAAIGLLIYGLTRLKPVKSFSEKHRMPGLILSWTAIAGACLLCLYPITQFFAYFNIFDYLAAKHIPSVIFEQYYVEPAEATVRFPKDKKNLIYIYLESMEITPSDLEHGGIEQVNIIPDLTDLAINNSNFNGDEQTLNGGIPLYGSTWTSAGMVAQSAGLPLKIDNANSNDGDMFSSFLQGATAIGDILENEGYKNVLMIGSNKDFGNRDDFFGEHGNYEIYDYQWAKETGRIPEDYMEWWGFEDAKLFEYAKEKASELAGGGGNFNLTLLTADTHFTDGYVCDLCGNEFDRQYTNVLRCANNQVSDFVTWVNEQEWGKDTVIVLSGDHLYMDSTYYKNQPAGYRRKTYVTMINSAKPDPAERKEYCTMDLFPTTLSALGCEIDGGRLALGTDLYSDVPTLLEVLGEAEFNDELGLYSKFYEESIMLGR